MNSHAAAAAKSLQSCPTLCDPMDSSPPGSPVPGILQARTGVGCHFLFQRVKVKSESEVTQSCLTLCNPIDGSPPGSFIHGIPQARVLEWGAIAFSNEQPEAEEKTHVSNDTRDRVFTYVVGCVKSYDLVGHAPDVRG